MCDSIAISVSTKLCTHPQYFILENTFLVPPPKKKQMLPPSTTLVVKTLFLPLSESGNYYYSIITKQEVLQLQSQLLLHTKAWSKQQEQQTLYLRP